MRPSFKAVLLVLGVFSASAAQAANAIVTTNLNVRTGPGTGYAALGSIPSRSPVTVQACTSGYGWCQINYGGLSGWASSRYLAMREGSSGGYSNNFGNTAALIGIPLIAGAALGAALNDRNDRWDNRRYERRNWNRGRWDRRNDWDRGRNWDRPYRGDQRFRLRSSDRGDGPRGQ
ncbi:SH3 domain-containing protein [Ochrobactrum chromiisoli]|uniref:SH3 domain-containing protein n=1 Tax=Ochrobactrum chromiisoli TaxID=2993941 RepID=A0ABT3QKH8_9HYPH|nr:SH3 domain-containing protein [Ochrobactrum chromiisoli]MCX2696112.1 SH3 domain-containing protein [Ochrobactrum chromiisoli]